MPEWKKRLEERKKQKEMESAKTVSEEDTPSSASKVKTKPPPISTTTATQSSDLKVPKSPRLTPTSRESSPVTPTGDTSLPKWKQELLARKKSSGSGPVCTQQEGGAYT